MKSFLATLVLSACQIAGIFLVLWLVEAPRDLPVWRISCAATVVVILSGTFHPLGTAIQGKEEI